MQQSWETLLANFAIVAVVIALWTQVKEPRSRVGRLALTVWGAAVFSFGVVIVMTLPFEMKPGFIADLRSAVLVLATFLGGPVVGAATLASAAAFRIWVGGSGVPPAIVSLVAVFAIGLAGRLLMRGAQPSYGHLALLAAAVTLTPFASMPLVPANFRSDFLQILPALSTLTFIAVCVAGALAVGDLRRRMSERQNAIYRAVIEALPNALNVKDRAGRFVVANDATARLMHAGEVANLTGRTDYDFYPRERADDFRAADLRVLEAGETFHVRQRLVFRDGSEKWTATTKTPLRSDDGGIVGVITHNQDESDQVRLEEEIETARRRLSQALTNMADGLAMFDADARIVMCNPQYSALFPDTAHLRVAGASLRDILRAGIVLGEEHLPDGTDIESWIEQIVCGLRSRSEHEIHLRDDRWLQARVRPSHDGTSLSVVSDITEVKRTAAALQTSNAKLERLASTDALTGLTNRRAFDEALEREFSRCRRASSPLSLLLGDVDHFKAYNDSYGHLAGDKCLAIVATCLRSALKRPADISARFGGEEFVALLPDTDASGALVIAESFRQAVRACRIEHSGSEKGVVTVTVGTATTSGTALDVPALLVQSADEALYAGKSSGRDRTYQAPGNEGHRLKLVLA